MTKAPAPHGRGKRLPRLNAAAYVRCAAEDQHASMENQREQIRLWATKRGFRISHFYEER
ncbi:MAG: recombinase family protein [Chloroflexi bacterium]|nr:recombinase family protein [Chloroflexota bacterium]